MTERVRLNQKAKSNRSAPARARPLALFGPPLLLEGEDAAAYDELVARMCAAVNPFDVLEEMFVADIVFLQWTISRYRRLQTRLISAIGNKKLREVLPEVLFYSDCNENFVKSFVEILQERLMEDQADDEDPAEDDDEDPAEGQEKEWKPGDLSEDYLEKLARQYLRNKPDAVDKVKKLLNAAGLEIDKIFDTAFASKVEELARAHARREPDAIEQVNELLAASGLTLDGIIAQALTERIGGDATIDELERIDRLIDIAETRRDASLREIEGRRVVSGATLRRNVQELEAEDVKVIEATSRNGKRAA